MDGTELLAYQLRKAGNTQHFALYCGTLASTQINKARQPFGFTHL